MNAVTKRSHHIRKTFASQYGDFFHATTSPSAPSAIYSPKHSNNLTRHSKSVSYCSLAATPALISFFTGFVAKVTTKMIGGGLHHPVRMFRAGAGAATGCFLLSGKMI
jgi:hypothetical protein